MFSNVNHFNESLEQLSHYGLMKGNKSETHDKWIAIYTITDLYGNCKML
jgi:hypothetical protein